MIKLISRFIFTVLLLPGWIPGAITGNIHNWIQNKTRHRSHEKRLLTTLVHIVVWTVAVYTLLGVWLIKEYVL